MKAEAERSSKTTHWKLCLSLKMNSVHHTESLLLHVCYQSFFLLLQNIFSSSQTSIWCLLESKVYFELHSCKLRVGPAYGIIVTLWISKRRKFFIVLLIFHLAVFHLLLNNRLKQAPVDCVKPLKWKTGFKPGVKFKDTLFFLSASHFFIFWRQNADGLMQRAFNTIPRCKPFRHLHIQNSRWQ